MSRAWGLTLLAHAVLLQGQGVAANAADCDALDQQMAHLNPGFWEPSFVFRSMQVRPGAIHAPNKTRQTGSVKLLGACDTSLFRADSFQWQKPTSDGGDWIASTSSANMQINIDGIACPLTGIAMTTLGWPSLRLQFEQCPRKTAVEVPLVNSSEYGMKLVHWMCKVSIDSSLCEKANALLPASQQQEVWSDQVFLDLSSLAAAASRGVSRMQVYSDCYDNLDWFVVNTPVGLDDDEWAMVHAMMKVLSPSLQSKVRIPSNLVVETLCIQDCEGEVDAKCRPVSEAAPAVAAAPVVAAAPGGPEAQGSPPNMWDLADSFGPFTETLTDKEVLPWPIYFSCAFFVLGSLLGCCCMSCCSAAQSKDRERRIKKVELVYQEVPAESQLFFTR